MGHTSEPIPTEPRTRRASALVALGVTTLLIATSLPGVAASADEPDEGFDVPASATVRSLGDIGDATVSQICQFYPQYSAFFPSPTPGMGIPLGGIGAGTFMINQSGTFGPWWFGGAQRTAHTYEVRALPQAAFHVYEKVGTGSASLTTLATDVPHEPNPVPSWESPLAGWNTLEKADADYSALYPFGWMDFNSDKLSTDVKLRFYPLIVAGEDKRTSLPVAYFDLQVTNPSSTEPLGRVPQACSSEHHRFMLMGSALKG
jgi:non-lysosomal glucosylceramidase